jgi:hypothetical protein
MFFRFDENALFRSNDELDEAEKHFIKKKGNESDTIYIKTTSITLPTGPTVQRRKRSNCLLATPCLLLFVSEFDVSSSRRKLPAYALHPTHFFLFF